MPFEPDYRNLVEAAYNRRPERLPLYEHIVDHAVMGRVLGPELARAILKAFIETGFDGGRHAKRLELMHQVESEGPDGLVP